MGSLVKLYGSETVNSGSKSKTADSIVYYFIKENVSPLATM